MSSTKQRFRPAGDDKGRAEKRQTLLGVLAVVVFAALAVLIVSRGKQLADVEMSEGLIGTEAVERVVATHDFTFVRTSDPQLEQERQAAAEREPEVWDYNLNLEEATQAALARGFRRMQREIRIAAEAVWEQREFDGTADPSTERPVDHAGWLALLSDDERVAAACTSARINAFATVVGTSITPDECAFLARAGFSPSVESASRQIAGAVMERHIVDDIRMVQRVGDRGIFLRTLTLETDDNAPGELISDYDRFLSLGDVPEFVRNQRWSAIEELEPAELRTTVVELAGRFVRVNVVKNSDETARRRADARNSVVSRAQDVDFRRGQSIINEGEVISAETVEIVQQMRATRPYTPSRAWLAAGTSVILLLLLLAFAILGRSPGVRGNWRPRDLVLMGVVLISHLGVTQIVITVFKTLVEGDLELPLDVFYMAAPFAAGAMIVRILTTSENAFVYTIIYGLLAGIVFDLDFTYMTVALTSGVFAIAAVRLAQSRTDILRASFIVGFAAAAVSAAMAAMGQLAPGSNPWLITLAGFVSGLTCGLFVNAVLPPLELLFRYTTSIKLLELANLDHPLLRDLMLKAPGSYHHSMMVGQLVEAACQAVGADALLGRVGSYYHDIGKMKSPHYFAENQSGENPHDKLKPNMSALVIKAHVKDGVEMAREHKLPPELIDFIQEHHGTSLIRYFYHRAKQETEGEVREEDYRYAGPRPQSRETAICMLADGIEAASRSLPDPSEAHLKGLVNKMINSAFTDGQLDECDLTLKDLNEIARAFMRRLVAMNHQRPAYPGEDRKGARNGSKNPKAPAAAPSPETRADVSTGDGADSSKPGDGGSDAEATDLPAEDSEVGLRRLGM